MGGDEALRLPDPGSIRRLSEADKAKLVCRRFGVSPAGFCRIPKGVGCGGVPGDFDFLRRFRRGPHHRAVFRADCRIVIMGVRFIDMMYDFA